MRSPILSSRPDRTVTVGAASSYPNSSNVTISEGEHSFSCFITNEALTNSPNQVAFSLDLLLDRYIASKEHVNHESSGRSF